MPKSTPDSHNQLKRFTVNDHKLDEIVDNKNALGQLFDLLQRQHEELYAALEAIEHQDLLQQSHQTALNAEQLANQLAEDAQERTVRAAEILKIASGYADERDRIINAINAADTWEGLHGFGRMLESVIDETQADATSDLYDTVFTNLRHAIGINEAQSLAAWLTDDYYESGVDDYQSLAEAAAQLAAYFQEENA